MTKKIDLVENSFYWVKPFHADEFEPAKCRDRYRDGRLWFTFTNGSVMECKDAHEVVNLLPIGVTPESYLRNKMTPIKNLITMIENGLLKGEVEINELINSEIKEAKSSLEDILRCHSTKLSRESLKCLVFGSQPQMESFGSPLLKKAGHNYSDQYGRHSWESINSLSNEELWDLHLFCIDSWSRFKNKNNNEG